MATRLIATTAVIAALTVGAIPAAAVAQDRYAQGYAPGYVEGYAPGGYYDQRGGYRDRDGYGGEDARRGYYSRRAPQGYQQGYDPRYQGYNTGYAQGYDPRYAQGYDPRHGQRGDPRQYRYRCDNNNGTVGTIIGAIAGGLIGNGVAGRRDGLLGTVIGGGAGALAGNAIGNSGRRC